MLLSTSGTGCYVTRPITAVLRRLISSKMLECRVHPNTSLLIPFCIKDEYPNSFDQPRKKLVQNEKPDKFGFLPRFQIFVSAGYHCCLFGCFMSYSSWILLAQLVPKCRMALVCGLGNSDVSIDLLIRFASIFLCRLSCPRSRSLWHPGLCYKIQAFVHTEKFIKEIHEENAQTLQISIF